MELYRKNNLDCSKITTRNYSSSFSLGVRMLDRRYRNDIYSIYGFVRYADEIVDTFFDQDQRTILLELKQETFKAIERGFSINPIVDSFQTTVRTYNIDHELIDAFLHSMEMDLDHEVYSTEQLDQYIYGSAEAVGLMCLHVFCSDEPEKYEQLAPSARKLGAAFQKVNFIRDAHDDFKQKGRKYFKDIDFIHFSEEVKKRIENEIEQDFSEALQGIRQLHKSTGLGVYTAYSYYLHLLKKIKKAKPEEILTKRFRLSGFKKICLLVVAYLRFSINTL